MTIEQNELNEQGEPAEEFKMPDELTSLKNRADLMGISYHPSIGVDKLRAKITAKLNDEPDPDAEPEAKAPASVDLPPVVETQGARQQRLRNEARKLVRVVVTCMNPFKREWEGEVFTVSNSVVGTHKKFVPFNNEEGWHVPQIILNMMEERQCQVFTTKGKTKSGKLIKEFAIRYLDPLTVDELKDLAQRQAMAAGTAA